VLAQSLGVLRTPVGTDRKKSPRFPSPVVSYFGSRLEHSLIGSGNVMSEVDKADLKQRIEESQHKIKEISAFRENAMIDKIIRAFQTQIGQDSYQLSLLDKVSQS
jgi:hypothetical protein